MSNRKGWHGLRYNAEAMGLNPIEVPKFFSGLFAIA